MNPCPLLNLGQVSAEAQVELPSLSLMMNEQDWNLFKVSGLLRRSSIEKIKMRKLRHSSRFYMKH